MSKKNQGGLVYSTNSEWKPDQDKMESATLPPGQQDLRVWLEKNHRGGKTASVIRGFVGNVPDLEELGRSLKSKCGTGGTVKEGEIIIQGDHRDKLILILKGLGYKSKKAGA